MYNPKRCLKKYFRYIEANEPLDLRIGDEVYWNDPDGELCSGIYKVQQIIGDIFVLRNEAGSETQAFRHELS